MNCLKNTACLRTYIQKTRTPSVNAQKKGCLLRKEPLVWQISGECKQNPAWIVGNPIGLKILRQVEVKAKTCQDSGIRKVCWSECQSAARTVSGRRGARRCCARRCCACWYCGASFCAVTSRLKKVGTTWDNGEKSGSKQHDLRNSDKAPVFVELELVDLLRQEAKSNKWCTDRACIDRVCARKLYPSKLRETDGSRKGHQACQSWEVHIDKQPWLLSHRPTLIPSNMAGSFIWIYDVLPLSLKEDQQELTSANLLTRCLQLSAIQLTPSISLWSVPSDFLCDLTLNNIDLREILSPLSSPTILSGCASRGTSCCITFSHGFSKVLSVESPPWSEAPAWSAWS